jgi:hypothetical protein
LHGLDDVREFEEEGAGPFDVHAQKYSG